MAGRLKTCPTELNRTNKSESDMTLSLAFVRASLFLGILAVVPAMRAGAQATEGTIVLTGADRRPAMSLNGEWASIVDPYFSGLYSFHHEEKKNGWFLN